MGVFIGTIIGSMIDPIQFIAVMICIRMRVWPWIYIPAITGAILLFQSYMSIVNYNFFSTRNIVARLIAITLTAVCGHAILKFAYRKKKSKIVNATDSSEAPEKSIHD